MTKEQLKRCEEMRTKAKMRFQKSFKDAESLVDLVQAYATYCGSLEAILDTFEITELYNKGVL